MTATLPFGEHRGVLLQVAAWDGAGAAADLSAVCLFAHEPAGTTLAGGARHVDDALGGVLTRLRAERVFAAASGDTLLLEPRAGTIAAGRLFVIGLGEPAEWAAPVTARAAGLAAERAMELGLTSVAFAPSLLDAGMSGAGTATPMIAAVLRAIDQAGRLVAEGLRPELTLRHFTFDAGKEHAEAAATAFRVALQTILPGDPVCDP